MAKFAGNEVLEAGLAVVAGANRLLVLAGQPASFAAAMAGALAQAAMAPADFGIGSDGNGGRRLTIAARPGLVATAAGNADHVALVETSGQRLLYVTTCPPTPLIVGSPLDIAAWQLSVGAPV